MRFHAKKLFFWRFLAIFNGIGKKAQKRLQLGPFLISLYLTCP